MNVFLFINYKYNSGETIAKYRVIDFSFFQTFSNICFVFSSSDVIAKTFSFLLTFYLLIGQNGKT
jgi:hypothetical protein